MKKHILFFFSFALFLFVACKKDSKSGTNDTAKTKSELLTAHSWKYSAAFGGIPGTNLTDFSSTVAGCYFDNTMLFKTNGTFDASEGSNKCFGEPASYSGVWKFSSDETMLTTTSTHDTTEYTIRKLDDNNLELSIITNGTFPWEAKEVYIKN